MAFIAAAIISGVGAAVGAGASIYGSMQQSDAAQKAQQTLVQQQQSAQNQIKKYLSPYTDFGKSFMPTLSSLLQPGPSQNDTLQKLPGFQFAKTTGGEAAANAATMRGLGGNALAAEEQFGTGLAQQYWGDYVSKLLGGVGVGSSAAGTGVQATTGLASSFGPAIAQTQIGQGNALAGGAMGVAGAAGGGLNNYLQYALLSKLAPGTPNGQNAGNPVSLTPPGQATAGWNDLYGRSYA
jgi:hypothetical protein